MKNLKNIIVLMFVNICFGQIPKGTVQSKYYEYCAENLEKIPQSSTFPFFNTEELCSVKKCFRSISYPEINEIIYNRLIELAKVNFDNKIFLCLIEGKESVEIAEKKNQNLEDDNNLIYISVNDYINAKEITKGKDIYNSETEKLMSKK
jgi:hypothetical protein